MIKPTLLKEITDYCVLNEISLEDTINKALKSGFTTLIYGVTPISAKNEKKPVEVVKTVEKIVEKIVKVSDDVKVNKLLIEIEKLKKDVSDYKGMFESARLGLKECEENNKKDIYGE